MEIASPERECIGISVRPSRPPGRERRAFSRAARRWSEAKMTPNVDATTSKAAFAYGSDWASPTSKRTSRFASAARARARSIPSSATSIPVTRAPERAASKARPPDPVPTSSTDSPGRGATSSTSNVCDPMFPRSSRSHAHRASGNLVNANPVSISRLRRPGRDPDESAFLPHPERTETLLDRPDRPVVGQRKACNDLPGRTVDLDQSGRVVECCPERTERELERGDGLVGNQSADDSVRTRVDAHDPRFAAVSRAEPQRVALDGHDVDAGGRAPRPDGGHDAI